MLSFIHAADLHLGCAFAGIRQADPDVARELCRSTFTAFDRIVDLAIHRQAAFVLFAGDTYNADDGNLQAHLHFRQGLQRLHDSGIQSFIIRGNHDPLTSSSPSLDWPSSVHLFPVTASESQVVRQGGEAVAAIYGMSYGKREVRDNLAKSYPSPDGDVFNVAMLHGNCGGDPSHDPYAPCTLEDLRPARFDYWALGHIHKHRVLWNSGPAVVYPGSPQGLNPKETGPHGCCHVEVGRRRHISLTFQETGAVRWRQERIDIAPFTREQELLTCLEERLEEIRTESGDRSTLVRFRLEGAGTLHERVRDPEHRAELERQLRSSSGGDPPFAWTESIRDDTSPDLDLDERARAEDFLGEFLRMGTEAAASADLLAELRAALTPLYSHARARFLPPPTDDDLRRILAAARIRGAGLLLRGEA